MNQTFVSLIITTKNSARTIQALLKSIKQQSYQPGTGGSKNIEIIIVDNKSSDKTVGICQKYTKKIFNFGPERSAQRNLGIKKSKGRYVFILDSDMVLSKDVVEECVKACLNDKKIGGIVIPEQSFGSGFWTKAKVLERKIHEGEEYFEAARFFPKKVLEEFKGYDEKITGPEDWDLPLRISKKYQIARIKSYIYHDEGRHSLIGLFRKKYYYGLSAHKFLMKNKIPTISSKTVYLLRPGFYKNWKILLANPLTSLGMIIMLITETIGGGLGYVVGRFKDD